MTEQRPVPPPGVYPPLPPAGGYQPPSSGLGYPPPQGQPVDALPTEAYTSWIRRVGAAIIDQLLFAILYGILVVIEVIVGKVGGSERIAGIIAVVGGLLLLAFLIWNQGYRQGRTGSSIGKSVLKFKVVSERTGEPIGF